MAEPPAPPAPRRQRILIVDDDDALRSALKALFETCLDEVDVETAPDGLRALEALDARRFDLLVSDHKMPGMSGLELLQRAQRKAPEVPRILMTAFPELDVALRAINDACIENFFTKPLDPEQTLQVVRTILQERRVHALRDLARRVPVASDDAAPVRAR